MRTNGFQNTIPVSAPPKIHSFASRLLKRFCLFIAVLLAEYAVIVSAPHPWCHLHLAIEGGLVFIAVFFFIATPSLKKYQAPLKLNRSLLALYCLSLAVIAATHLALLRTSSAHGTLVLLWFAFIPLSVVLLLFALIPVSVVPTFLRLTRTAWLYAAVAAFLTMVFSGPVQMLWDAPNTWAPILLQRATLHQVSSFLLIFYPAVISDPTTYVIRLPNFGVTIAGYCSGIEGLCLTVLFSTGWLWYARRELRFPRALVLIPCAMALIWTLNILRIAALLAIGNAGHPLVAEHGFHTEAGWIAFNCVSLAFLAVADKTAWLHRTRIKKDAVEAVPGRNVAAVYLLPFLAILAAASLSKAVSSGFEWAYPLRFIAAAAVLWFYRAEYRRMDWSFSWLGPALGVFVFVMWLGVDRWIAPSSPDEIGRALAVMSTVRRLSWLLIRVTAAVVTVPIAEELAFRGFLLRRIDSADVESVSYKTVTIKAILFSSIAFGALHGHLWLAGIVAGIVYALALKRTGRVGEAIAAHATTNLLLAIWVIARGDWQLW